MRHWQASRNIFYRCSNEGHRDSSSCVRLQNDRWRNPNNLLDVGSIRQPNLNTKLRLKENGFQYFRTVIIVQRSDICYCISTNRITDTVTVLRNRGYKVSKFWEQTSKAIVGQWLTLVVFNPYTNSDDLISAGREFQILGPWQLKDLIP